MMGLNRAQRTGPSRIHRVPRRARFVRHALRASSWPGWAAEVLGLLSGWGGARVDLIARLRSASP
eukprot:11347036-Alexandrium_andersonii.AAC.1